MRSAFRFVVLMAAAVLSLAIAELALRRIDARPTPQPEVFAPTVDPIALHYAAQAALAPGVISAWFESSPAPLPRAPLPADLVQATEALSGSSMADPALVTPGSAVLTRVPPSELFKAWNSRFIQDSLCTGDPFFHRFPGFAFAFDPADSRPHPRYRYLAGVTTPSGLVTNSFGWRGPDVAPDKPAGVVRLAFVGASTTVGSHGQAYSYPEFVAPWLNLWAAQHAPGIRFEIVNAGREGISSTDIAAVVRQEVAAVEPDVIVYYEGANQFAFPELVEAEGDAGKPPDELIQLTRTSRFALLRRLDTVAQRWWPGAGAEPQKPPHRLRWPTGVDELGPDADDPSLPLDLPRIVRDLDDVHATARGIGARLIITSFVWMVEDGMVVDPVDQRHFLRSLNVEHWPATYAEIRRMADFQNRVLRAYAVSRQVPFIDMAGVYPRDSRLFGDAVHRSTDGDRLHGWLLFQQLVPLLQRELQAGRLPSPDRKPYGVAEALSQVRRIDTNCSDYGQFLEVSGAISIATLTPSAPEASVTVKDVVEVVTPPARNSYAAEMPIRDAIGTGGVVHLRLRVVSGEAAVGVLSRDRSKWLATRAIGATREAVDVYLPVPPSSDAGAVVITNNQSTDGVRSVIHLIDAGLKRRPETPVAPRRNPE